LSGTSATIAGYVRLIGRFAMDTLETQDSFEPYYDGRKNAFARVNPRAVEKAKEAKERIEHARKEKVTEARDRA
jgi:hypothetical protein